MSESENKQFFGMKPTIGQIVLFRSRSGGYDMPAIITATQETLPPAHLNVRAGHIPDLDSPMHVHLNLFSPAPGGRHREWNIPRDWLPPRDRILAGERSEPKPGSWRWPV